MRDATDRIIFSVRSALGDLMYVLFITPLILMQRAEARTA